MSHGTYGGASCRFIGKRKRAEMKIPCVVYKTHVRFVCIYLRVSTRIPHKCKFAVSCLIDTNEYKSCVHLYRLQSAYIYVGICGLPFQKSPEQIGPDRSYDCCFTTQCRAGGKTVCRRTAGVHLVERIAHFSASARRKIHQVFPQRNDIVFFSHSFFSFPQYRYTRQ